LAFREALDEAKTALGEGDASAALAAVEGFELTSVDIAAAVGLQLLAIELGLKTVAGD
jgi:hypothetical protein